VLASCARQQEAWRCGPLCAVSGVLQFDFATSAGFRLGAGFLLTPLPLTMPSSLPVQRRARRSRRLRLLAGRARPRKRGSAPLKRGLLRSQHDRAIGAALCSPGSCRECSQSPNTRALIMPRRPRAGEASGLRATAPSWVRASACVSPPPASPSGVALGMVDARRGARRAVCAHAVSRCTPFLAAFRAPCGNVPARGGRNPGRARPRHDRGIARYQLASDGLSVSTRGAPPCSWPHPSRRGRAAAATPPDPYLQIMPSPPLPPLRVALRRGVRCARLRRPKPMRRPALIAPPLLFRRIRAYYHISQVRIATDRDAMHAGKNGEGSDSWQSFRVLAEN